MTLRFVFWLLMLLSVLLGLWVNGPEVRTGRYGIVGSNLLLFILLFLLGVRTFGWPIEG